MYEWGEFKINFKNFLGEIHNLENKLEIKYTKLEKIKLDKIRMTKQNTPLDTYEKTVLKIFEFAKKYQSDCLFLESKTPFEVFEFIKNLEYKKDPEGIEFLSRPKFSIFRDDLPRDCDDKTLIAACYFELKNISYKIIVSGRNSNPHHVYPIAFINNEWIVFDATYPTNKYNQILYPETFRKIYSKI